MCTSTIEHLLAHLFSRYIVQLHLTDKLYLAHGITLVFQSDNFKAEQQ